MMDKREEPASDRAAAEPMERALRWFTLLQDGAVSESDRMAFKAWYAESPENGRAYGRITALWGAPELTAALARYAGDTRRRCRAVDDRSDVALSRRRRPWIICLSAVAAMLLVMGFFGTDAVRMFGPEADYRTGIGEMREVVLPDGSVLRLNTATAISVDIAAGLRRVRLLDGEGFFDVVRDATRPFEVSAGRTTVRVLGTSFAVNRDGERVTVGVKSGRVAIRPHGEGGEEIHLSPGELVEIAPGEAPRKRQADREIAFAWLSGRIAFRDARLGDVLTELGRYYDGWIYLAGDIGDVRVSGNFRNDDPAAVALALVRAAGGQVTRLPPGILIVH